MVAPALTPAQIATVSDPLAPTTGAWDWALVSTSCEGGSADPVVFEVTLEENGALLNLGASPYRRISPGVYGYGYTGAESGIRYSGTLQVLDPQTMQLDWNVAFPDGSMCDAQSSIRLQT
jgi:hypothetical protein